MTAIHDLAAPYALDALDREERSEFEAHLESCSACQSEVAKLQEAAASLASAASATPPQAMKDKVMEAVGGALQEEPKAQVSPLPRRRWLVPSLATAAAVFAVLAIGLALALSQALDRAERVEDVAAILALPDARTVVLEGPSPARLVYSDEAGRGVLVMEGVAAVPRGETYQLWLVSEAGASPSELFTPDDGSVTVLIEGDFAGSDAVGVTVELAGGSPSPTGDILYAGALERDDSTAT